MCHFDTIYTLVAQKYWLKYGVWPTLTKTPTNVESSAVKLRSSAFNSEPLGQTLASSKSVTQPLPPWFQVQSCTLWQTLWPIPILSHPCHMPITHPINLGLPDFSDHGTHQVLTLNPDTTPDELWLEPHWTSASDLFQPDLFPHIVIISCYLIPLTLYLLFLYTPWFFSLPSTITSVTPDSCPWATLFSHSPLSLTLRAHLCQIFFFCDSSKNSTLFRGLNRDWVFRVVGQCSRRMPLYLRLREPPGPELQIVFRSYGQSLLINYLLPRTLAITACRVPLVVIKRKRPYHIVFLALLLLCTYDIIAGMLHREAKYLKICVPILWVFLADLVICSVDKGWVGVWVSQSQLWRTLWHRARGGRMSVLSRRWYSIQRSEKRFYSFHIRREFQSRVDKSSWKVQMNGPIWSLQSESNRKFT